MNSFMKFVFFAVAAYILIVLFWHREGTASEPAGNWHATLEQAHTAAQEEPRDILILFTGSDWCPPCQQMDSKIFSSETFEDYSDKNLHLVRYDLLRKSNLPSERQQEIHQAAQQFGVQGFPTYILIRSGEESKRGVGMFRGSASDFVQWLRG